MKKLMILGANDIQLPLYKIAKEKGYYVVACDRRDNIPGIPLADKHYKADFSCYGNVLQVAREEKIDGIISNSEPAMLNVAKVATELGLPGNTPESIETLLSKNKFRELQRKTGAYVPEHGLVSTVEELIKKEKKMRHPVIIKPVKASGTRGTTRLDAFNEFSSRKAFEICRKWSRDDMVAVEEYVEMPSLRVNDADVFVVGEEILWDGTLWEDRSVDAPMLPMTEIFPMALPEKDMRAVREAVNSLIRASGVKLGEYNVETYFTSTHEVFVIEINPRQAGNYIPQLIFEHTGVDLTKLLVTTAVGDMDYYKELKELDRENNYITCQVVFAKMDGVYEGLYIAPEIEKYVQWVKENVNRGDKVVKGINAGEALAFVDLKFDSYETQHKYTDDIEKYVYARILTDYKGT